MPDLARAEAALGYRFKEKALLRLCFTHASVSGEESNERLEFLGDSVLGFVVADALYNREPELPEGRMTRVRAQLVCEDSLKRVALELGLGEHIRLGRGEEHTGGRHRTSILADAVEALIAAMYLDGGLEVAGSFIRRYILSALDTGDWLVFGDGKTELQELVQRKSGQTLSYELVSESGPDHDKTFIMRVLLNGVELAAGEGRTKKEAEQAAARSALKELLK